MIQYLIAFDRICMMIGMALQLKQEEVTNKVTSVPGMQRIDSFIFPFHTLISYDAIVFDLIDEFEQCKRKKALGKKENRNFPNDSSS